MNAPEQAAETASKATCEARRAADAFKNASEMANRVAADVRSVSELLRIGMDEDEKHFFEFLNEQEG